MPDSRRLPSPSASRVTAPDRPVGGRAAEGVEPDTLLRAIAESAGDALFAKDREGRLTFANAGTLALVGKPLAEVLGRTDLELLADQEAARRVMANDRRIMDSGEGEELEELVPTPDGRPVVWLSRKIPFRDASGRVIGLLGISRDVTPLKESEAALRRGEEALRRASERLQAFVESDVIGILFGDVDGRVYDCNDELARIIGRTRADVLAGKVRWTDITPAADLPLDLHAIEEARATGRCHPYEKRYVRPDGAEVAVQVGYVLYDPARTKSVAFVLDVSARRAQERRVTELVEALTRSNAELDQFAYVASHDLKAPLRGIANLSEWLEEDLGAAVTPDAHEKLVLLRGRVQRLEGLIDGILQYSRAGRSAQQPEAVDVGALVREVVELLPRPAGAQVVIAPDLPALVTERVPLQQVFMNLVSNAFKHARREAPRIVVSARDRGASWEFEVADNGQGIAPQYHDRIWGLFQTLEARDKVEGTGIGLAVVRKIVERRGGRAWVESSEGQGATFRFTWPRHG